MSVYMMNLSFNHFENLYVIAYHEALISSYKSSHAKLVVEKLLNEIYEIIKMKVSKRLKTARHFSFFINEITNIRKKQMINLCCHVSSFVTFKEDSFQLKADTNIVEKMTAIVQVKWVVKRCEEVIENQLNRVNCIIIDTCAVMKFMWIEIEKISVMKHVFFLSCDSHDLQLLLEDILKFLFFSEVLKKTQFIVISFRNFSKELSVLWSY